MNNVFKFESLDGVPYIFDNNNGIIYEDLTSSNSDNTRIKEYNEMYLQNLRKSLAVFENLNLHDITVDEIANYYEESGFTELIFKMTDACNMRCKYCIYSEHYQLNLLREKYVSMAVKEERDWIENIKAQSLEKKEKEKISSYNEKMINTAKKQSNTFNGFNGSINFLSFFLNVLTYIIGGIFFVQNELTLGGFMAVSRQ